MANNRTDSRPAIGLVFVSTVGMGNSRSDPWSGVVDQAQEQDANLILFPFLKYEVLKERYGEFHKFTLAEKEKNQDGILGAEIIVSKNKMGPKGIIQCKFDQRRMRFFSEAAAPY